MLEYTDGVKISQYLVFIDERQKYRPGHLPRYPAHRKKSGRCSWNPLFYDPWRRWRPWYVRIARRKSRLRKAGQ